MTDPVYYLALSLMILIGSMFLGLIVAAWMRSSSDETDNAGAEEGAWWR